MRRVILVLFVSLLAVDFVAESEMYLEVGFGPVKASRLHEDLGAIDYFKDGWQTGLALRYDLFIFSFQFGARRMLSKYRFPYNLNYFEVENIFFQTNEITDIPVMFKVGLRPLAFLDSWPLQFFIGGSYESHAINYHFTNMYPVWHNGFVDYLVEEGFPLESLPFGYVDWPSEKTIKTRVSGVFLCYGFELRCSPKTLLSVNVVQGSLGPAAEEDPDDYQDPKRTKEMVLLQDWLWQGHSQEDYNALDDFLDKMKIKTVSVSLSVSFR